MSRKQKYDFDKVMLSNGFIKTIEKSCIQNHKTYEILARNSDVISPSRFCISELNGYARMEIPEKKSIFESLFENYR